MNGYVRLFRKFINWEWYKNTNTKIVFLHCLLKANWDDGKFEGLDIKRGSFVTGRKKLSEELGISEQQVRTALNHLISTKEITIKKTSKFSIITINNYEEYQLINQEDNQQSTNNQPTINQQLTTNEKEKEEKEEKEYIYNNNICELIESNFGNKLSPIEHEVVSSWNDNDLTRYAIKQAIINGIRSIKYIDAIIRAYKRENIKTVQQAQEREEQFKNKNQKNERALPNWFEKKLETTKLTEEEEKELTEILNGL